MRVFKLKNNRLNNRDINIDQNNRDYDFSHNRPALVDTRSTRSTLVFALMHSLSHLYDHHPVSDRSMALSCNTSRLQEDV